MQSTSCEMPSLDEAQAGIKIARRNIYKKKKKNSCPEEITSPIPLDQSSLDHLFRPSLSSEIKRKKKGGSKRHFKSQAENYEISVCLDLCMSQYVCVFSFFIILLKL